MIITKCLLLLVVFLAPFFTLLSFQTSLHFVLIAEVDKKRDKDGWLCDYVHIKTESSGDVFFSVYDMVVTEIAVRAGKGKKNLFSCAGQQVFCARNM